MIQSKYQLKSLSIGQVAIKGERTTKYATCVLCNDVFALMPSYVMKGVSLDNCAFDLKNLSFQTMEKLKPLKILGSADSSLSILIFKESASIIDLIKALTIQINPEALRKANLQRKDKVNVHGYGIEYRLMNGQSIYQSKRKSLNCPYRTIIQNQIHYDCPFDKNGMIGSALCMEDQKWIGIHQGGQNQYGYGILFTAQVVQKLINLLQKYYYPKVRCLPTPEVYYQNENSLQQEQSLKIYQNLYQSICEQYSAYNLFQIQRVNCQSN